MNPKDCDQHSQIQNEKCYRQVYVIRSDDDCGESNRDRNVLFQCGCFHYEGTIPLDFLHHGNKMSILDIPEVAPLLQRYQKKLTHVPKSSSGTFLKELQSINDVQSFLEKELTSARVQSCLDHHRNELDLFDGGHYFELVGDIPDEFDKVECICAKSYTNSGLCLIIIYFEGIFYSILSDISDDEPLLDIHFPDVSRDGDGLTLATYDEKETSKMPFRWRKLSLWQTISETDSIEYESLSSNASLPSQNYAQTYCILKPNKTDKANRDVLFRFGNWCYTGDVELIDTLNVEDIPHVIPALRVQQHNLAFLCSVSDLPSENMFTETLLKNSSLMDVLEREILSLENHIEEIENRLSLESDFKDDVKKFFFEFSTSSQHFSPSMKNDVDLIATKTYRPNGLVVMTIFFGGTYYVCISEGDGSDQPLLDCEFPDVVQGKGYQVKTYPNGLESFPELRRLKIWHDSNVTSPEEVDKHNDEDEDEVIKSSLEATEVSLTELAASSKDVREVPVSSMDATEVHNLSSKQSMTNNSDHGADKSKQVVKDEDECKEETKNTDSNVNKIITVNHTKMASASQIHHNVTKEFIDYKAISMNQCSSKKKNFGAFHHLAPLKKASNLGQRLNSIKPDMTEQKVPYDNAGKPLHGY